MNLKDYFHQATGTGVLATADSSGKVDAAIYARPHILDDGSAAFIMRDRLTHSNLKSNPYAAYLFIEEGIFKGKRLFLNKIREEKDSELLYHLKRRPHASEKDINDPTYLVIFRIEKVLPLIGASEQE